MGNIVKLLRHSASPKKEDVLAVDTIGQDNFPNDKDTVSQRYRRRYVLPRRERNRYSFGKMSIMNPNITRATPSKIILPKLGAHDDVSESDEMSIMNPNITRATPSKVILSKLGAHDDVSESDQDTVSQRYRRRYVLPRRERNRYSFGKDTVSQRHRRRYIQPRRELSRYSTGNTSMLNVNKTRATPSRIILPKLGAHEDVSETDQVHCDSNDFCQKVSPAKRIEIWEFDGKNRFTTVSETWSVSACIRHVKGVIKVFNDVDL
ncbi:uncharacterized protein [Argopecten irradians]|uniref:uncharacterized protein n=1 Tax=Argopecten irradians TaxID=31199 RepID=UPI0037182A28